MSETPAVGFGYEFTSRCNLRCVFCYNYWHGQDGAPAELTTGMACHLLGRLATEVQPAWLCFSGGEPLLRDDLEELVAGFRRHAPAARIGLSTNGLLLDAARLEALLAAGVDYFELPLFTGDEEDYRQLTGSAAALQTVLSALALIRARGAALALGVTLLAGSRDRLATVFDLACALGASVIGLNHLQASGRAATAWDKLAPSRGELAELLALADRRAAAGDLRIDVATPLGDCQVRRADYPHLGFASCACGETAWVIGPDGSLRSCAPAAATLGSLLTTSFAELRRRAERPSCGRRAGCPAACRGSCRFTRSARGLG